MAGPCCRKPIARIIKVGTFDVGIVGLDAILRKAMASRPAGDQDLGSLLLAMVREGGNYITPGTEDLYKSALLREFARIVEKEERKT